MLNVSLLDAPSSDSDVVFDFVPSCEKERTECVTASVVLELIENVVELVMLTDSENVELTDGETEDVGVGLGGGVVVLVNERVCVKGGVGVRGGVLVLVPDDVGLSVFDFDTSSEALCETV